ncbi:MAG: pyruvate, phosphate dikinase [Candidatus Koribacter versatilis]|uniref:Pyruvate, phosphate dikinase n=1 Tax=Candidatus Korobacter versatilis TaxID=658062 RepID=A0A932A6T7_9BACT|nr:pyruvate, phosphate dikinase [Candidatus Koribacter versatilis]
MSTVVETPNVASTSSKNPTKYVYFFGAGKADGTGKMKSELGGKGAGLAEMTNAGLPVPPGFTIQTEACREYMRTGKTSAEVEQQTGDALARLEKLQDQKLGQGENPLLVSVRSGAKFSMPGMMDTILNLGLNDESVQALAKRSHNPRFAYDSYRRLIQMFGSVVLDIPKKAFDEVFDAKKKQKHAKLDTDLDAKAMKEIAEEFKKVVKKLAKTDFPQAPAEQLAMARDAVFRSWNNDRAKTYRRINAISDDLGTAVTVQCMVFGNLGNTSGTGVGFTRNPSNGGKEFYGEFLMNAQGEDVVAGIRTPLHISELKKAMPAVYDQLRDITSRLERHYRDMQDFEFTIQDGKLYMLQTRNGKRTGRAAARVAIDMVNEDLITREEAIFRIDPNQLYDFLVPKVDEKLSHLDVLTVGLPASPGAAVGQIVFTADDAVAKAGPDKKNPVILVRSETTPEDIHGMEVAVGILTARGGMTSHAAVVTRGMGKCCVAGAGEVGVDDKAHEMRVKGRVFRAGDWISLDGTSGRVIAGKVRLIEASADDDDLQTIMKWAEPFRRMRVRANADIPRDAIKARSFGAEGIGLCRTEHMFFETDRIAHMRTMIMAYTEKERRVALRKLLPMQREDFAGVFRAMDGFPVTIRLLDPPLHEFLPRREDLMVDVAKLELTKPKSPKLKELRAVLKRVEELHEINPMLGHRGCRLGITYPEISEMQTRAIFEAAVLVAKEGVKVAPEVMIPLVSTLKEMQDQAAIIRRVAEEVFAEKERRVGYMVGTMIELPRAAMCAEEIAAEAEFFSFGTNDLTQTTFGFSRDDINKFLPIYLANGILKQDPFAFLDQEGVGKLVQRATVGGRKTRAKLKVGICGEHGGEPSSVEFCHHIGLDYVSCSPYRVLTARLAAAQAAAREKLGLEGGATK